MKQYIDKSVLMAGIDRRIKERDFQMKSGYWVSSTYVYEDLLDFIDTLEVKEVETWHLQEEPVSEDLGEYINELSKQFPDVSFAKLSRIAVRVAKWGMEQAKVKIQAQSMAVAHGCPKESITEDLEFASEKYACRFTSSKYGHDKIKATFKECAQWQKEQTIEKACEWLKEQDEMVGISFTEDFIIRFKDYIKGE